MNKTELLRQKIQEIDKLFQKMEALRSEVIGIVKTKNQLEKQIIKLFRKTKYVDSIETTQRVYRVEKHVQKDVREKVLEHLSNYLLEKGVNVTTVNAVDQWKKKMFKAKRRSKLIVLRKV